MLPMRTHVSSTGLLIRSDPAQSFTYPTHIDRACLDALPSQPGIYIFRDGEGAALYVGKSVNIRTRVLSHLRTQDEGQMLARTRHIDFELCGGEIGALLRESQLIKQLQPVFNQKLRRLREMCSLRLAGGRPEVVFAREVDFARTEGLYGLFGSRKAALEVLRSLAESVRLCCAVIGLEKTAAGRPCFGHQLGRCGGACVGVESADDHAERLLTALEPMHIAPWPFAGAVGIVEVAGGRRFVHLVDHWNYLGQGAGQEAAGKRPKAAPPPAGFDIDVYQILVRPLLQGGLTVEAP
jgi:excinuclease Cho